MPLRASLVAIGNSRGIRIPKSLIDECNLGDTVELSVADGALVVRRANAVREGWEEAFAEMADLELEPLLDADTQTEFDQAEWEWPER